MSKVRPIISSPKVMYHIKLLESIQDEINKADFNMYADQVEDSHINEKVLAKISSMVSAGLSEDCQA